MRTGIKNYAEIIEHFDYWNMTYEVFLWYGTLQLPDRILIEISDVLRMYKFRFICDISDALWNFKFEIWIGIVVYFAPSSMVSKVTFLMYPAIASRISFGYSCYTLKLQIWFLTDIRMYGNFSLNTFSFTTNLKLANSEYWDRDLG